MAAAVAAAVAADNNKQVITAGQLIAAGEVGRYKQTSVVLFISNSRTHDKPENTQ